MALEPRHVSAGNPLTLPEVLKCKCSTLDRNGNIRSRATVQQVHVSAWIESSVCVFELVGVPFTAWRPAASVNLTISLSDWTLAACVSVVPIFMRTNYSFRTSRPSLCDTPSKACLKGTYSARSSWQFIILTPLPFLWLAAHHKPKTWVKVGEAFVLKARGVSSRCPYWR